MHDFLPKSRCSTITVHYTATVTIKRQ